MLTRLSDNLLKLEQHSGLKNWAAELRKLAAANITLHLVLTKKSELNLKLSPNPVRILNFEEIYSSDPIQIQQNLL